MSHIPSRLGALLAAALLALPVKALSGDFDDAAIATIAYPAWFKASFLDLQDDLAEAGEEGKQGLFLFFTTEGCSYCHLFIEKSLGDPAIAERVRAHFDTIGLEIFDDAELTDFDGQATRVKEFALRQGVQFAPTLVFYDIDGNRLLRLTGYYEPERFGRVLDYLVGRHYEQEPFPVWLASRSDPPETESRGGTLIPDSLFSGPPYALDRSRIKAQQPLLVLFEAPDCARCERFHAEVLEDPVVRPELQRWDIVRLDARDQKTPVLTPDGKRTNPAAWRRALGFTQLPALVFFDESGRQVLETDALVLKSRMMNAMGFVAERAYENGWTYQRFARSRALARAAGERDDKNDEEEAR